MNSACVLGSVQLFSVGSSFPMSTVLRVDMRFRQEGFAKGEGQMYFWCVAKDLLLFKTHSINH